MSLKIVFDVFNFVFLNSKIIFNVHPIRRKLSEGYFSFRA